MIYREPVVDGIPLIRHETLFIERPQCTGFLDAR
jgi:hypothetical protein